MRSAALCLALALGACTRRAEPPADASVHAKVAPPPDAGAPPARGPAPAEGLVAPAALYEPAVYHLPQPKTDPGAALDRLLQGTPFTRVGALPAAPEGPAVHLCRPPIAEYAPLDAEALEFFGRGLSPADMRAFAASKSVSVLEIAVPSSAGDAPYRAALALADQFAKAAGGLLWDERPSRATPGSGGSRGGRATCPRWRRTSPSTPVATAGRGRCAPAAPIA